MSKKLIFLAVLALSACASRPSEPDPRTLAFVSPTGEIASPTTAPIAEYRIGAADKLNVTVFQVENLSLEEASVDAAGMLQVPLIGQVQAAGLTSRELAAEIADRLRARYLRDPQVSVSVAMAASQKVTVDGAVTKPGVYEMRGRTTLLQAVAMAEGPTRVADLEKVVVFRSVDGRRMAALFDLSLIRAGRMADPYLEGDDVVIVDASRLGQTMRDIIQALPGLAVFAYL